MLTFSPAAWIKLQCFCHLGESEVGGFGLVPDPARLLVTGFEVVRQRCSLVSVAFDDDAVADYFEAMVAQGCRPEQFGRVWLHTHPGDCPLPSGVDEDTFARVFGRCDWAVMFILARGGATYARLRFGVGPRAALPLAVKVAWHLPFENLDPQAWQREHAEKVTLTSVEAAVDPSAVYAPSALHLARPVDSASVLSRPLNEEGGGPHDCFAS